MAWSSGLQLRVTGGNDEGRVIPLNSPEITLGRAVESSQNSPGWVLFSEPTVSRIHALLQWSDEHQCYILQHRSRTNPTLVDSVPIDSHPLHAGETVGLGLLEFVVEPAELRTGKLGDAVQAPGGRSPGIADPVFEALNHLAEEKSREHMAGIADLVDAGMGQNDDPENAFRLVVAQGPDQGTSFTLNEPVLIIGRRQGPGDPRSSAGVLLHDVAVPPEQAVLVWQDRPCSYGILQSDESKLPTRIRRITNGVPKEIIVRCDTPTVLNERDVIMMGKTALIVRRGLEERGDGGRRAARQPAASPRQEPQVSSSYSQPPAPPAPGYAPQGRMPEPPRGAVAPSRSPLRSWKGGGAPSNDDYGYPPEPQAPPAPGYGRGGYPNTRGGYPNQQPYAQDYDSQNYPPERGGYPNPGYPEQDYDQGYADPAYPRQDYPEPEYQDPAYPPQGGRGGYDPRYDSEPRARQAGYYDQGNVPRDYHNEGRGRAPRPGSPYPARSAEPNRGQWQGARGQYGSEPNDYYPEDQEGDIPGGYPQYPPEQEPPLVGNSEGLPTASQAQGYEPVAYRNAEINDYNNPEDYSSEDEQALHSAQRQANPERFASKEQPISQKPSAAAPSYPASYHEESSVGAPLAEPEYEPESDYGPDSDYEAEYEGEGESYPIPPATEAQSRAQEEFREIAQNDIQEGAQQRAAAPEPQAYAPVNVPRPLAPDTPPAPPVDPAPVKKAQAPVPVVESEEQLSEVVSYSSGEFGSATNSWQYRSDYVIVYQSGNRKGQKVALLASEINDERAITIGSPGSRNNDIEVDEPTIANDQAVLRYRNGRFSIMNFHSDILVNKQALLEGDQAVLMTGDQIQLGNSVLVFLERRAVEILRAYCLEVVDGIESDLHKRFNLKRERMTIGRDRSSNIKLADQEVSRNHCALVLRGDRFYIQHRSDINPTFINGISVLPGAEKQVTISDRIQVSSRTVLQLAKKK